MVSQRLAAHVLGKAKAAGFSYLPESSANSRILSYRVPYLVFANDSLRKSERFPNPALNTAGIIPR